MQYEIDVLGSAVIAGALRDPYLVGIHDSSGNLIENTTDDNSGGGTNSPGSWIFDASTGGIYYIAVRSADGGTGTYRVNVSRGIVNDDYAADTSTTGTVAVGGFATGRIEAADDVDWFAVELLAGVEYRIDLRGSDTFAGTLGDPYLLGVWHGGTRTRRLRMTTTAARDLTAACQISGWRPTAPTTSPSAIQTPLPEEPTACP